MKEEDQLNKWVANSFLINFSQGFTSRFLKNTVEDRGPSAYDQFKEKQVKDINHIKSLMQKGTNKILFIAAGNENISISEPIGKWKEEEFYLIPKEALLDPFLADFTIIVGGIDQFFRSSSTSNFPSLSQVVQDNFILTLGKNIKLLNHGKESLQNGTSFASPIAAGAAALLKQKYPDFSAQQIKEVILESASKNFFIEKDSTVPGGAHILVYDPADPFTQTIPSNAQVQVRPFDPSLYGKGILNLQAAFVYGDLKVKHPTWDKKRLRTEMQTVLSQQLNDAAVILQKAFKKYQAQKKLKPIKRPKANEKNRK
ncbi:MAG: S8 family serine peptidase [Alphaproteobacteria bacterium]